MSDGRESRIRCSSDMTEIGVGVSEYRRACDGEMNVYCEPGAHRTTASLDGEQQ
jgi:hypothetical protein